MESAGRHPIEGDWLAFVLPAGAFCFFDCLAPTWLGHTDAALIRGATFGAFAGQLLWGATWCALGPGRWIHRMIAVVAVGVVIVGVMTAGIYLRPEAARPKLQTYFGGGVRIVRIGLVEVQPGPREMARNLVLRCVSVLPLALLIAHLPLCWNRATRGWRIIFRQVQIPTERPDPRTFGIADLLAATAGIAIVLGFWRINLLAGSDKNFDGLGLIVGCVIAAVVAGFLGLPIVPFALGDHPPRLAFAYTCAYIIGLVIVLGFALSLTKARGIRLDDALRIVAICLAAAAMTMHVSFWIARDVGYRFVRLRRK